MIDVSELAKKIHESTLDESTKVHLAQILERGPTAAERSMIDQLLEQNRRHKFVDSHSLPNSNPR